MLIRLKDLDDYAIGATDGRVGRIEDFYFDDRAWVIRYLVVDTGSWLASRKLLISPISVGVPDRVDKLLPVSLTKAQVESSPDIDTAKPVSRQHEADMLAHYGYPDYWGGGGLWGDGAYPGLLSPESAGWAVASETPAEARERRRADEARHRADDPHLRSCRAITGYHIRAGDGEIGHVDGFLVDEQSWAIRYLIVNTSNWWLGHTIVLAPQWIAGVHWGDSTVSVNLSRQQVQDAPAFDPAVPLERAQEADIHGHYGRSGYWADEVMREAGRSEFTR